ncbi:MAG: DUF2953 domain-containing protein [Lachnospiraceae bacterium]|nr:DUF2953 domain-containing protein [Lachnospiraceae bacterium]
MWHMIVIILKIIGIGLLLILSLLLLALLAFLFVPVRYDIWGKTQGDIQGRLKITWLLHAVSVPILYQKGQLTVKVKLLGIPIMRIPDSRDKPSDEKADKAEKDQEARAPEEEETAAVVEAERTAREQELSLHPVEISQQPGSQEDPFPGDTGGKKRKRFSLADILVGIREKLKKLQYTICQFCAKIREGRQQLAKIKEFIMLDSTRAALRLCKGQLFYLLKKIRPRKIQGWVHFGTGDPALTGEILGGISALYAIWPCRLMLQPDFQHRVLEGEIRIRGRMRMCTFVGMAWRLWRDKNIKAVYKKIRESARGRK